ncbi:MAG TPA: hypothetical protein VLK82_24785 [Candidatus Tectomicrobia bacterium]|nr:hypothetical protein [Candidatus Tectomicrobia bacterium]
MAFTVEDFRDLIRLLEERPEWRAELRRWVLSDELLTLPELVRALAEAQRRTEEQLAALAEAQRRTEDRLAALADRVAALAEAQRRTEEQLAALAEAQRRTEEQLAALAEAQRRTEDRLAALEEAQRRTEEQLAALAEAQRRTEEQLAALIGVVRTLTIDVGELKGDALERRYRERAYAYFAPLLRRARVLAGDDLMARLEEAVADGQLSEAEAQQVSWADLVMQGRRREDDTEVYLVVEASWQVDVEDVERTAERAALLGRTGMATIPVVAGRTVTEAAARLARTLRVWQVTDGRVVAPER